MARPSPRSALVGDRIPRSASSANRVCRPDHHRDPDGCGASRTTLARKPRPLDLLRTHAVSDQPNLLRGHSRLERTARAAGARPPARMTIAAVALGGRQQPPYGRRAAPAAPSRAPAARPPRRAPAARGSGTRRRESTAVSSPRSPARRSTAAGRGRGQPVVEARADRARPALRARDRPAPQHARAARRAPADPCPRAASRRRPRSPGSSGRLELRRRLALVGHLRAQAAQRRHGVEQPARRWW